MSALPPFAGNLSAPTIEIGWNDLRGLVTLLVAITLFLKPWGGSGLAPMNGRRYARLMDSARQSRVGWWVTGSQTLLSLLELALAAAIAIVFSFFLLLGPANDLPDDDVADTDSALDAWVAAVALAVVLGVWHQLTSWVFYAQRFMLVGFIMNILTVALAIGFDIAVWVHYSRIEDADELEQDETEDVSLSLAILVIGWIAYLILVTGIRYYAFWQASSAISDEEGEDSDLVLTGAKQGKSAAHLRKTAAASNY